MKRGLDLRPCAMSNSGTTVSVFEYFCLCHSQPVGWTNQLGMAKEQSHSWLSAEESKPRSFSLPSDSQCSTMEWHPMGVGVPLCKGLTSTMVWKQNLLPRLHPQHPLVKTPSARLLQCSNGANKRQLRKTNTSWNGGAGWGRRRKTLWSADSTNPLWGNGLDRRCGREKQEKRWEFSLLMQTPAGTLLQSQQCPLCTPLLSCSLTGMDFGASRSLA